MTADYDAHLAAETERHLDGLDERDDDTEDPDHYRELLLEDTL
jgi:hypothetical protein